MWNVLRAANRAVSINELAAAAGTGIDDTRYYTRWLCRAGHVSARTGKYGSKLYVWLRGGMSYPQICKADGVLVVDNEKGTIWRHSNDKN